MKINFKHPKVLEASIKVFKKKSAETQFFADELIKKCIEKGYTCEKCERKNCVDQGSYELDDLYVCQDCYESAVTKGT